MKRPLLTIAAVLLAIAVIIAALVWHATRQPLPRVSDFDAAQALFQRTVTDDHLPSAEAKGGERDRLLGQAAAGYERLLKKYPDESYWCAQALRSLGNVRASQGEIDQAVRLYEQVAATYANERWEALQALKSAADLCREHERSDQAQHFYRRIVADFSDDDPPMMKTIVGAARRALDGR